MQKVFEKWLSPDMQQKLIWVIASLVVLWVVLRFVKRLLARSIQDTDALYKTRKATTLIGYILGVLIIITTFSSKLSSLTVLVGAVGVGIAFALQEIITSLAGWLALMFREYYKVGDRVEIKDIVGDVIDISPLRTTLMETGKWIDGTLYNGRIVKVANSYVFKEPIYNFNSDFPFLWDEIKVAIKYGSDYELARKIFLEITQDIVGDYTKKSEKTWDSMVHKYRIEDAQTEPMVTLVLNDNWVEFTLRYITDFKSRRSTRDKIFSRILHEVENSGNKIQFASATFEITTHSADVK
jgi:small-conductance mechanosensitive channel